MKKKILVLGMVVALLSVLVVPMAALADADTTNVTGTVADTPTISELSPNSGLVSTMETVAITGTNFVDGETTVNIDGEDVSPSAVTFNSATDIDCDFTIGADAASGVRNVTVTVGGKTSTSLSFTVTAFITVTAPNTIVLGYMTADGTATGSNEENGSVATNSATWTVTAADETTLGYMKDEEVSLDAKMDIGRTGAVPVTAEVGFDYTQATDVDKDLPFFVSQDISSDETAGSYSITITFTGSL